MLLTWRIYLNHDSDCDRFACQFLARSFSGEMSFQFFKYNIGGGLEKCYIVLRKVGGLIYD